MKKPVQHPFPIVGVGASAGGLEAFTQLLRHLPADTGMAFVLVQHLAPDHPSQLASLLARETSLRVLEIKQGMTIKRDHVYVIPPNKNLEVAKGKLMLVPRRRTPVANSVDHFFVSLAREHESCAIGVILSGTGSDGTAGLIAIKSAGGITFAQDEKSAKFSSMPEHAVADAVDFILPPEKIAQELARIGRDPNLSPRFKAEETLGGANLKDFQRVLVILRVRAGVDLSQYRDTTIKRRIQRRMVVRTRHTLADYIDLLEADGDEVNALFNDVLINVTGFFRDPEVFETLKRRIFPEILKTRPAIIRVWVTACSAGQEAYSVAIALLEFLEQKPGAPRIQIFATDLREDCLEKGRAGYYADGIEAEVSPERLRRYFTKEDGGYRISKAIRDLCVFARQNVAADPPFSRMDLISCRNLLIYLTPPLQRQVVSTFHYALNPSGYLLLGSSETAGANADLFEVMDRKHKIQLKKGAANRPFSHFSAGDLSFKTNRAGHHDRHPSAAPVDFQKEADRILLGRFAPAGVLVNSSLEVLQFRGRTSPYLEPPTGEASFNLLKMARENLLLELGTALRKAKKTNTVVRRNVRLNDQDKIRKVNLEVIPVKLSGSAENCYLVLFDEADKPERGTPPAVRTETVEAEIPATEQSRELKRLRTELAAAREYLQVIIEQQEAASEELKCANEEVLSSNEELQSTNEQLGTAKEELQSTNEELQTLNEELQTRNTELNQLNNDLNNLLGSVQIPILMLGNDLRVRRYNPAAVQMFHLKPAVTGRPVHSLDSPIITADLEKMLLQVIQDGIPKEMEIRNGDGRWFSLRLHPYRTADNRIDGVVLALVNIVEAKRLQAELTTSLEGETAARECAEAAGRAKDAFLATLSHELRTPLNAVLLVSSDAAGNRDLPSGIRASFDAIRKDIELEARLIDDLLDMTRITSGKLSLKLEPMDVHALLREAIKAVKIEAGTKQISVGLKLKATRPLIMGDPVRLQQVFWNVFKNAVKFTPKNGKVRVETLAAGDGGPLLVKIADTGIGLTARELERLFTAFSQGEHARNASRFGGLGLGLAISQKIVELHSGRIQAASKGRDQGAVFTIELPLASAERGNVLPKKRRRPGAPAAKPHANLRILLVEDHEPTRAAITSLLTRRHYEIVSAGSLAEARLIAGSRKIDAVISDIGLPDGNGNELMSELSKLHGLKGIALTGYGMEQDVSRSLAAGFVTHLTKPVQIQALEKALGDLV